MQSPGERHTCAAIRREVEQSLRGAFDPADVLPRLALLARLAPATSDDKVFAHRQLAELLVERHPWRAALYARRALAQCPEDDRSWAVLAFSHTLLGNFRSAELSYRRALAAAPANPWYAHNLGHLLDVALGAPDRAIPWLRSAHRRKSDSSEITASFVHALARAGRTSEARSIASKALERFESRELEALLCWLDQGAPQRQRQANRPHVGSPTDQPEPLDVDEGESSGRDFARVLRRGLSHLPLDARQRQGALRLARDILDDDARQLASPQAHRTNSASRGEDVAGLAAAVAYAIVYVDHVPLSQAEVAAPFRVAVGRLRGHFAELRAELDIIPGDVRYASNRLR
jgi:Flp pilus assembly protein TadD